MTKPCMIPKCQRLSAQGMRGLCMMCYSRAKKRVDAGEVTWDKLAALNLCDAKDPTIDAFDDAYSKAMKGQ